MEAEVIKLAQAGVAALQAGPPPNWAEIVAAVGGGVVGLVQCGLIAWGLRQMGKASEERSQQMRTASEDRNRQLDIMETGQREQSRIQADTLGQIGAALDHPGRSVGRAVTAARLIPQPPSRAGVKPGKTPRPSPRLAKPCPRRRLLCRCSASQLRPWSGPAPFVAHSQRYPRPVSQKSLRRKG